MYGALRKALFRLDPETAHHAAMRLLGQAHRNRLVRAALRAPHPDPRLETEAFGVTFDNPLGLAAGFDKEASAYNGLLALGFGHVEVGTVTPRPQPGNDRPRIQRFPEERALVNRMGFPGPGMDEVVRRMTKRPPDGPVGINIGPNKDTPAERVGDALARLAERLAPHAHYLAVNVSSPNTPGLRDLQTPKAVGRLIRRTLEGADGSARNVPVLLKVHPDEPVDQILGVSRAAVDAGASGIVAINTTRDRLNSMHHPMDGGMSGAPLHGRAVDVVRSLHHGLGRDAPIVGVGGVFRGGDVFRLLRAGASLVQTYTGFIYEGPRMPVNVQRGLLDALDRAGLDRVGEAVGTA